MNGYILKRVQSWEEILSDFKPGTDLFQEINNLFSENSTVILIQSELIKRWLQLRFSEMGWVFLPNWQYPSSFFKKVWLETESQPERLIENSELPFFALKHTSIKNFATALEVSEVLQKYTENFPEILEIWCRRRTQPLSKPEAVVEQLWRACLDQERFPLGWYLLKMANGGLMAEQKPPVPKIIILGASFLSVVQQKFLLAMSQTLEVVHYLLEPLFEPQGDSIHQLSLELLQGQPGVFEQKPSTKPWNLEVRLTACWGERRELETAIDDIFHLLNQEPYLPLHDIGLVSLDWAKYRLYLSALLDPADPKETQDAPTKNPEINLSHSSLLGGPILKYQLEEASPIWEECFSLLRLWLELSQDTWTRTRIIHYLNHPWIKAHLELDQIENWGAFCEQTQFRWGIEEKEVERLSPQVEVHASLAEAWGRFVRGLSTEDSSILIPDWHQVKHFAIIKAHLDLLSEKLGQGQEEIRTWRQWSEVFHGLVQEVIQSHPSLYEEAGGQSFITKVFSLFEVPQPYGDLSCSAKDFADFLLPKLQPEAFRPQLLVQGLSLGNLERFRGIPFDTLVLLGMNEDFPREDLISPYDVLYQEDEKETWKLLHSRSRALGRFAKDRTFFIDLVSQAKKRVWIYHSGFSLTKDELKRPSALVEEFVRKVEHVQPNFKLIKTETSIYHFERYHEGDSEKTFYQKYADVGLWLSQTSKQDEEWTPEPFRRYSEQKIRSLSSSEIFQTCKRPLGSYLKYQLDFYTPWFLSSDEDNNPDVEKWGGQADQYLNLLMRECVKQGQFIKMSEATKVFKRDLESGALGKWREKPEDLPGFVKEALKLYEELYENVQKNFCNYSIKHTYFPDNYYFVTNDNESALVIVSVFDSKNLRYDQLITLLWVFYQIKAAGLIFPSKIYSIKTKPEEPTPIPELSFYKELSSNLTIFSELATFYQQEPFMMQLNDTYALERQMNTKRFGTIEDFYQRLLDSIEEQDARNQRTRYELTYLLQGKRLPSEPPEWFQQQYQNWKDKTIIKEILCGG